MTRTCKDNEIVRVMRVSGESKKGLQEIIERIGTEEGRD